MIESALGQWRESLMGLWTKFMNYIPTLFFVLATLFIGWLIATLLQKGVTKLLEKLRLDKVSQKVGLVDALKKVGLVHSASEILGKLVFWMFMLTFLISAAEALGLEAVSTTIHLFVGYLPKVFAAGLIVIFGLLLAHFVAGAIRSGAENIGVEYGKALAKLAYGVLLVVVMTLALNQLGIETGLINRIIEIVLLAIGLGLAIALGMGSREVTRNLIAGLYARDIYEPETRVTVAQYSGVLCEVGSVSSTITSADGGIIHIPNIQLIDQIVVTKATKDFPMPP